MNYYSTLTHCYSLSKTLRNELIPVGKTLEYIKVNEILLRDKKRSDDYKKVKLLLDEYHKAFIARTLNNAKLTKLEPAVEAYINRSSSGDKQLEEAFDDLRTEIAGKFKKMPEFAMLDKKNLIEDLVPAMLENKNDVELLNSFKEFTTYFTGYNQIRKNLYSSEKKSSTVAYRLVDENLPRFLDNIGIYKRVVNNGLNVDEAAAVIGADEIDSIFDGLGYSNLLTQTNIDAYNEIVGKLNSIINEHNQHLNKDEKRIPKMKVLYKMLLSDRTKSFQVDSFTDDSEIIEAIISFADHFDEFISGDQMDAFVQMLSASEGCGVYIKNDTSLTSLAVLIKENWDYFRNAISDDYDKNYTGKKTGEKREEEKKKVLDAVKSYQLSDLMRLTDSGSIIELYIDALKESFVAFKTAKEKLDSTLSLHDRNRKLSKNTSAVENIKTALDSIKDTEHILQLLSGTMLEADRNELVYGEWTSVMDEVRSIDRLYNMSRAYLTKKPFSTEKFKLNFDCPTFLDGWDKNKEKTDLGVLLFKDEKYYLGVAENNNRKVLSEAPTAKTSDCFKKMEYKQLSNICAQLPRIFIPKKDPRRYNPSDEILAIYERGSFKKGTTFDLTDCHKLIDFFKKCISIYPGWEVFEFKFSPTSEYEDISGFYREVERQSYKINYRDIDSEYISNLVNEGKLFLFQIYNQNFAESSTGKLNLHTIYWKMLFDQRNLENIIYKLNGEAAVFYRPASIKEEELIVHKTGKPIKNKNSGVSGGKAESSFTYDIVKDRRYSQDKFFLHVPITMNFCDSSEYPMNVLVNNRIRECEDIRVIGIDRGERNLLYIVVVDSDGKILEQISLNSIVSGGEHAVTTNYHEKLSSKEKDRMSARKNWQTIESIKELKEGYMSQVVHVIAELILKYNAIVVLEDLNMGFKRSRSRVEKSVYQKFEKMLIDKLHYLVMDKSREQQNASELGGALNALQVTESPEKSKSIGQQKQNGIVFYVPAYLTSKIDPTTGFANLFYCKYESVEKAQKFVSLFDKISYNAKEHYFEFEADYDKFTFKAEGTRTKWTICSYGNRIEQFRNPAKNNSWDWRTVSPTEKIIELLNNNEIEYLSGRDLIPFVLERSDKKFYQDLLHCFNLVVQLRNSSGDGIEDYIQSPVRNKAGVFYNSSECEDNLPKDADANGAYNIARKGLWVIEQIRAAEDVKKVRLAMTNKEWLKYIQED